MLLGLEMKKMIVAHMKLVFELLKKKKLIDFAHCIAIQTAHLYGKRNEEMFVLKIY